MFGEKEKPFLFHDDSFSIPPAIISPSIVPIQISPPVISPCVNISPVVTKPTTVSSSNIPHQVPSLHSSAPSSSSIPVPDSSNQNTKSKSKIFPSLSV
jgi:hypothetical protein